MSNAEKYLGFLKCESCNLFVYIRKPDDIRIWHHPDDEALAEVTCVHCGAVTREKLSIEHLVNFKLKGCEINKFGAQFGDFTEQDVDDWDIQDSLIELLGKINEAS